MTDSMLTYPRGHGELAVAALAAYAAAARLTEDTIAEGTAPTIVLMQQLDSVFAYAKKLFPDNERIAGAVLTPEFSEEDGEFQIDSEVFGEYYVMLPVFARFTDEDGDVDIVRATVHGYLEGLTYTCVIQMIATDEGISTESLGLPTKEDFRQVGPWLFRSGYNAAEALEFIMSADVVFGADDDGTLPIVRYHNTLRGWLEDLEGSIDGDDATASAVALRRIVLGELKFLLGVLNKAWDAHQRLDTGEALDGFVSSLTGGMLAPHLPETKIISAEYLSYIYNREADRAPTLDLAEDLRRAAIAASTIAMRRSGSGRHAKYISQNMLDIAHHRDSDYIRQCAEAVWMDAYIAPSQVTLLNSSTLPARVGWSGVELPRKAPIRYEDIPSYLYAPEFIYFGIGADVLGDAHAGFSTDYFAAALLLVQHFKALPLAIAQVEPDLSLPLFDPDGEGYARYPLWRSHPVAWTYHVASSLFAQQAEGKFHAGLAGLVITWDERFWVERVIDNVNDVLDGRADHDTHPGFPLIASRLIGPAVEEMRTTLGGERKAAEWGRAVEFWAVD
jgi:hypothetical protein